MCVNTKNISNEILLCVHGYSYVTYCVLNMSCWSRVQTKLATLGILNMLKLAKMALLKSGMVVILMLSCIAAKGAIQGIGIQVEGNQGQSERAGFYLGLRSLNCDCT